MKNKIFTLLLTLVASVGTLLAKSGTCGDNLTWNLKDGVLTISGKGDMYNYSDYYGNNSAPWYSYRSSIISVVINKGVTSIGDYAFDGCDMTSVTIPNSVTSIGDYAFVSCIVLTSITIPHGVTSIGHQAFHGCRNLTSVTIPPSVESIGYYAFDGCTSLTTIEIPNSVISIEDYAFDRVPNIVYNGIATGSPWGARSVNGYVDGWFVYSDNTKTTLLACFASASGEISIPESVTSIGDYAFYECNNMNSVTIPNSVISIGYDAFENCTSMTSITIPNSVTSIEGGTFFYCTSLTSIEIPNSVTSIGNYAFFDCRKLASVTIPSSVTSIGENAFMNVINVVYDGTATGSPWGAKNVNGCVDGWLVYRDNTKTNLLACSAAAIGEITIPNSVTSIGEEVFSDCSNLTSITIPNSVTSIGNRAFYRCSGLTSITIPSSVTSIGERAFYGCSGLTSITIPNNVTSIGNDAFYECSGLTSINVVADNPYYSSIDGVLLNKDETTLIQYPFGRQGAYIIPNSVTGIGDEAFAGCAGLTSITIPNSVTSIGYEAFFDCSSLVSVTIGNGVQSIGYAAFSACTSLTSIEIPNSVQSMEYGTFAMCTSLTSVAISNSITSIEEYTFYGCSSLTSIEIPNSVTSIGERVFFECSNLTSIEIPNSVTSIGEEAFSECSSLVSVTIGDGVTSIEKATFSGCSSLTTIIIGNSVASIGEEAFSGCSNLTSIYNYRKKPATIGTDAFEDVDYFDCTLYVLAGSVEMYKSAGSAWKDFFCIIKPIGAETVTTNELEVTPTTNTVNISWPIVSGAESYELVIKDKDGNVICTLVFNAQGHLTSIAFSSPGRNATTQAQAAGFLFTVTGLDSGTGYDLTMISKDALGQVIEEKSISFTTGSNIPTWVENVQSDNIQSTKLLRNGQVFVVRGEKTYTMQGQEVK